MAINNRMVKALLMTKYSVLVIDDNITTVKLIADALVPEFEVLFATSAKQGLKLANENPNLDVIILDIMLPETNGFEVCKQLKSSQVTQSIPVLFATALDQTSDQEKGFELGAVDYITKPIEIPLLRARTKTHARLRRQIIELEHLAATDPLTSCANRRTFNDVFKQEWKRSARTQKSLAMLMIDVDDFKQYNDHYGHGKGDECLIAVSRIIKQSTSRPGDLGARYGGEEFAVLMPDTDLIGAQKVASNIIQKLASTQLPHEYSKVKNYVTVSIGVSCIQANSNTSRKVLLEQADKAMYQAKAKGKNCFVVLV